ncbi:histone H2A deubiquitinase MYSM1-like [Palaemon carinicauda]|uniref:histone H2A deubiquitinase MYSM1-like n=1 Tax=Palaemon carinicauda TaxID=392227 RepID=UPI0035B5759C
MASSDDLGSSLDVDVVGLVDLDFKSEPDFFDFDSGGEFGLFGEEGVALNTASSNTHSGQPPVITSQNSLPTHAATVNSVNASGSGSSSAKKSSHNRKSKIHWNEIEKDLFIKGMELFGPNWGRISNFIATKTPSQVRSFHKKWAETANIIQEPQTLDDTYVIMPGDTVCITTDLEDPLGLIETATTTVTTTPFSPKRERSSSSENRKGNNNDVYFRDFSSSGDVYAPPIGEGWEWVFSSTGLVNSTQSNETKPTKKSSSKKQENRKNVKKKSPTSIAQPFKLKSPSKSPKKKKKLKITISAKNVPHVSVSQPKKLATRKEKTSYEVEGFAPSVLEGQVVHLIKDEREEESDVDIDVSDDEQLMIVDKVPQESTPCKAIEECVDEENSESKDCASSNVFEEETKQDIRKPQTFIFPTPTKEVELDSQVVTEEEKKVHYEYFDGRGVKTPERYLRIRNYLLNFWKQTKPKYMKKTSVRAGLKHCGDVNSIGKVHEYLEKIGAINFGCPESNYSTPLVVGIKHKEKVSLTCKPVVKVDRSDMTRQKQKKKWDYPLSEGGGLTISHDESGAVIDACHIPEAPRNRVGIGGGRSGNRLEQFKLVRCLEHDPDTPAPFSVVMHAHALITLDLHSHTSLAEVMGLLGGYYDPAAHILYVTVAVPTRAVSSGVECDMCPISQSTACTTIHEGGVQVVGWYHSHPTFPPNPSIQDIDTQSQMQQWFARQEAPFLGIIVSPFCPTNQNEASHIRCIVLDRPPHGESESEGKPCQTPYKLSWSVSEVIPGGWEEVCREIRSVVGGARDDTMAIDWRGEWRGQITNWEKAISSLNHHLPSQLHGPLQAVRMKFLAAVREYMDS